ncbi:MAG: hypothetical protein EOP06_03565 [Proteobacteria bacterium]|nr:MAG: hypothetical protein EOP06_03565 [Pseudomonadota bacterium]
MHDLNKILLSLVISSSGHVLAKDAKLKVTALTPSLKECVSSHIPEGVLSGCLAVGMTSPLGPVLALVYYGTEIGFCYYADPKETNITIPIDQISKEIQAGVRSDLKDITDKIERISLGTQKRLESQTDASLQKIRDSAADQNKLLQTQLKEGNAAIEDLNKKIQTIRNGKFKIIKEEVLDENEVVTPSNGATLTPVEP